VIWLKLSSTERAIMLGRSFTKSMADGQDVMRWPFNYLYNEQAKAWATEYHEIMTAL